MSLDFLGKICVFPGLPRLSSSRSSFVTCVGEVELTQTVSMEMPWRRHATYYTNIIQQILPYFTMD